jgi:hypothetical protein
MTDFAYRPILSNRSMSASNAGIREVPKSAVEMSPSGERRRRYHRPARRTVPSLKLLGTLGSVENGSSSTL